MNKAILISIRPEHLVNILNGKKTLELRKTVPKDYKGWVYIYCTKGKKDILHKYKDKYYTNHYLTFTDSVEVLNGKVVARFWFDEYDTYSIEKPVKNIMALILNKQDNSLGMDKFTYENLVNKSCVDINDIWDYAKPSKNSPDKQRWIYAWHIKKLKIFDEPLALKNFYKHDNKWSVHYKMWERLNHNDLGKYALSRPPQSWQYVYKKEEK